MPTTDRGTEAGAAHGVAERRTKAPACMWCGMETALQSAGRALALYVCRVCAAPTVSQERTLAWTKLDHQIAAMFHRCAAAGRVRKLN